MARAKKTTSKKSVNRETESDQSDNSNDYTKSEDPSIDNFEPGPEPESPKCQCGCTMEQKTLAVCPNCPEHHTISTMEFYGVIKSNLDKAGYYLSQNKEHDYHAEMRKASWAFKLYEKAVLNGNKDLIISLKQ